VVPSLSSLLLQQLWESFDGMEWNGMSSPFKVTYEWLQKDAMQFDLTILLLMYNPVMLRGSEISGPAEYLYSSFLEKFVVVVERVDWHFVLRQKLSATFL
jgi:hypothetical protein